MSTTVETATGIRPFHAEIAEEQVDDLRRRVAASRWPTKELVADRSQGVQLEALHALARYWLEDYDFGRVEARLNALPQFVTARRAMSLRSDRASRRPCRLNGGA